MVVEQPVGGVGVDESLHVSLVIDPVDADAVDAGRICNRPEDHVVAQASIRRG